MYGVASVADMSGIEIERIKMKKATVLLRSIKKSLKDRSWFRICQAGNRIRAGTKETVYKSLGKSAYINGI